MSVSHNLLVSVICCFSISFDCGAVVAQTESPCPTLNQYIKVCHAQLQLIERQADKAKWRYQKLSQLRNDGFASWQEVQRQKFNTDTLALKAKYYCEFMLFLKDVSREIESRLPSDSYVESGSPPVKVFLPGSSRMIGWIQGAEINNDSIGSELDRTDANLKQAEHRLEKLHQQLQNNRLDQAFRKKLKLDLEIARQQMLVHAETKQYLEMLKRLDETENVGLSWTHTVTPATDKELASLVSALASLEANFDGKLHQVQRHLDREQNRLEMMKRFAKEGKVNASEIRQLDEHVTELRNTRNTIKHDTEVLQLAAQNLAANLNPESADHATASQEYSPVNQWPDSALLNFENVRYLIQQRWNGYQELARTEIAKRKIDWIQEIIQRLDKTTRSFEAATKSDDRFARMLKTGQQKELDNYVWRLEGLQQSVTSSETKAAIHRLEEQRFLVQADLMNDNDSKVSGSDPLVDLQGVRFLTSALTTMNAGSELENQKVVRYRYIESKILDSIGHDAELVFSQNLGYPMGVFAADNDLLNPVQLTSYRRSLEFARIRPVRFNGPNYSGLIERQGRSGNSFQNSNADIAAPSLYNSPFATNNYRNNQRHSIRFYERAYPFGILRSDLRRYLNSSQPPWLLPGSPNNLRYNQLRTDDWRKTMGGSGSTKLKSKNYRDLSGPSYFN